MAERKQIAGFPLNQTELPEYNEAYKHFIALDLGNTNKDFWLFLLKQWKKTGYEAEPKPANPQQFQQLQDEHTALKAKLQGLESIDVSAIQAENDTLRETLENTETTIVSTLKDENEHLKLELEKAQNSRVSDGEYVAELSGDMGLDAISVLKRRMKLNLSSGFTEFFYQLFDFTKKNLGNPKKQGFTE